MSEDNKVTGFAGLRNLTSDNEKKPSSPPVERSHNEGTAKPNQNVVVSAPETSSTDVRRVTGFSGLGSLTSDKKGKQQSVFETPRSSIEHKKSEDGQASHSKKTYEPIQVLNHASMPTPWSSVDDGETWEWGDYLLAFQKEPESMAVSVARSREVKPSEQGIFYPFVLSVFEKSVSSKLPILVYTVEQANIHVIIKNFGSVIAEEMRSAPGSNFGIAKFCRFIGSRHENFGNYTGEMDKNSIRKFLLDRIGDHLNLQGRPKFIGIFKEYLEDKENDLKESQAKKAKVTQEMQQPESSSSVSGATTKGSGKKWVFIIISALIVLGLILFFATRDGSSKNENKQPVSSEPVVAQRNSSSDSKKYKKPPIGVNHQHSVSEIRWCLRQKNELMNASDMRLSKDERVRISYNSLANDYNARCGSYKADTKDIEEAERDTGIKR